MQLELSYAARAPWVPSRRQFQLWVDAAWTGAAKAAVARVPAVRGPAVRGPAVRGPAVRGAVLSIHVVGKARSRTLNRRYRHKDRPTNVLSFAGPGRPPKLGEPGQAWLLGELVICAPVVAAEARVQHKGIDAHWAHMTIHGMLHLLGFDHEVAAQAAKMESREVQILDRLGFSDPYA